MPIMEVKATLVIVNNTLVRQWKDELTKFAPTLKVHTFYATRENKERCLNGLREADVIITTPHMVGLSRDLGLSNAHLAKVKFRRLVVDESHLLAGGAEGEVGVEAGLALPGERVQRVARLRDAVLDVAPPARQPGEAPRLRLRVHRRDHVLLVQRGRRELAQGADDPPHEEPADRRRGRARAPRRRLPDQVAHDVGRRAPPLRRPRVLGRPHPSSTIASASAPPPTSTPKTIVCGEAPSWENDIGARSHGGEQAGVARGRRWRRRRRTASSFRRRRPTTTSTPPWSTSSGARVCRRRDSAADAPPTRTGGGSTLKASENESRSEGRPTSAR